MLGGIALDNPGSVRHCLNRFTHDELLSLLPRYGYPILPPYSLAKTKGPIVEYLLQTYFQTGMSFDLLGQLDMEFCFIRMQTRLWKAYELVKGNDDKTVQGESDPETLVRKLDRVFSMYFSHHLVAQRRENIIWLRLLVVERGSCNLSDSAYMAYVPNSPYLLMAKVKLEYRDLILQGVITAFGCTEFRELDLTGKNPASLLDLLVNKHSQGAFTAYRLAQIDSNPLERKKAKRAEDEAVAAAAQMKTRGPENLVLENGQELAAAKTKMADVFGTHEQPKLDRVDFELETMFRGGLEVPGLFKCRLHMEGTSILDGLKALVDAGAAQVPLPTYLGELHSSGTNSFSLKETAPEG